MTEWKSPITLVEAIAFWFEKNEIFDGWGPRTCPMPSEEVAKATFSSWVEELTGWKGPAKVERRGTGQWAEWPDIRIKLQGFGLGLWIRPGRVWDLWGEKATWEGGPCRHVWEWKWEPKSR